MLEHWKTPKEEIYRDTSTKEETKIEYSEDMEYDTKTLKNDLPNLKERIAQLEKEGWKVFTRGDQYTVLERVKERDDDNPTVH